MHTPTPTRLALALAALFSSGAALAVDQVNAPSYGASKQQMLKAMPATMHAQPIAGTEMRVVRDAQGHEHVLCKPVRTDRGERARTVYLHQQQEMTR